ncbi:sigma-54-dependent Fis family transcriptional regulator [Ideonella sp.]|jgi:transcriptional regulator of acetoin/glycerol metabolism|uniref:sigma-54-dependent Fis family transcriptional regulator n=1 Tax=Ideonella sp. TaxID=1929293 RepID=UPI0037BEF39B
MPIDHPTLRAQQRSHMATVMQVAEQGLAATTAQGHDAIIRASWQRCVHQHRLDPTRMQEAVILPQARLREHQDQMEAFLHIARHGLETLYQQVAGMGYAVLLTDDRGVTVDFIGDQVLEPDLRRAGLYMGADWSEHLAGTCGVGTCLSTGQALTVHLDDHFDATHIPLTCTAAPVWSPTGELRGVLDISQLSSTLPKASQSLALQLVQVYAHHIENAAFVLRHRRDWVLRLSGAPQFLDVNPEYLLALDERGCVVGHNHRAQRLLEPLLGGGASSGPTARSRLLGQPFERLFEAPLAELHRFMATRAVDQRAIRLVAGKALLFMLASPPPGAAAAPQAQGAPGIPEPLAALSGGDPLLERQLQRAAKLVNSPISLLVTGETGSGKEYFAKALHQSSERRSGPFVAVNCAAIPDTLIESELFGHLPGSFSGAGSKGKRGLIQEADGGTLFLDEIGDMPHALQARLLRVLAEHEVLPIGATRPIPVKLRVIAATHCPLEALVREGRFRDDLYYRLNGAHFVLPPLRERQDLPWLVQRLLRPGGTSAPSVTPEALACLQAHAWPGNLRELANALAYARSVGDGDTLQASDLPDSLQLPRTALHRAPLRSPAPTAALAALPADAQDLLDRLHRAQWNVSAVARDLGCARMTLYRRMARWGLGSGHRTR